MWKAHDNLWFFGVIKSRSSGARVRWNRKIGFSSEKLDSVDDQGVHSAKRLWECPQVSMLCSKKNRLFPPRRASNNFIIHSASSRSMTRITPNAWPDCDNSEFTTCAGRRPGATNSEIAWLKFNESKLNCRRRSGSGAQEENFPTLSCRFPHEGPRRFVDDYFT